jgi:hypothetical protein
MRISRTSDISEPVVFTMGLVGPSKIIYKEKKKKPLPQSPSRVSSPSGEDA